MRQNYLDRMMNARDPRFAKIAARMGYKRRDMVAAPAPEPIPEPVDPMAGLRAEYERIVGRRPFMGWGEDVLRARIASAR